VPVRVLAQRLAAGVVDGVTGPGGDFAGAISGEGSDDGEVGVILDAVDGKT